MKRSRIALLFVYSCFNIIMIFLKIFFYFLLHPSKLFTPRKIYTCPPSLQDQSLGMHQFITVNGIKLHCVISGPENAPVMLMLHGFPEFWYSWRYQIREFNKDYRVIAVDLRGYGESDKPLNKSAYTITNTVDDVIKLLKNLGVDKCTLLCHDWGGLFGWGVVLTRSDLVEKFVVMCCPHPGRYNDLVNLENDSLFRQWYFIFYQLPYLPEMLMRMEDFRAFKSLFRSRKYGFTNREIFTDEDMQSFLYTFSQNRAFTGPINYIRNVFTHFLREGIVYDYIYVPTLILNGEHDPFISTKMAEGHEKYVQRVENKIIRCGHWMQQDMPVEVNSIIRQFLTQN
ncbi:Epoxide hydrolase 4-like [Oopsacas minuta]|uniref:Epoxide hydrolase 4-like n=1 Tax=Oopsacas minuta TaxID=111878 RepID=A0AAV7JY71_9METZ|nr:Epoxide hydrolase 4-like [Oopsacas minuta]